MKTLPLTEVKAHLSELVDEVHKTHERIIVTRNGRDTALLISTEDMESIEATMELFADPEAQARVARSDAEFERGDFYTLDEVIARFERRRHDR
ncbi:MAG TPA: type II toxin-antitoxin system Phd/YefM family antitoxin [Mycobacteriales bacterium]|nr:type II toxin-antitoxin system Phd/YefM family antitoxin [Mycobacteriales bacterium]